MICTEENCRVCYTMGYKQFSAYIKNKHHSIIDGFPCKVCKGTQYHSHLSFLFTKDGYVKYCINCNDYMIVDEAQFEYYYHKTMILQIDNVFKTKKLVINGNKENFIDCTDNKFEPNEYKNFIEKVYKLKGFL